MNRFLLIAVVLLGMNSALAQDTITKKDGSELNVAITEINATSVKYQKNGLSIAFSEALSNILIIKFSNGETMIPNVSSEPVKEVKTTSTLQSGEVIQLSLMQGLSSEDLTSGSSFNLRVMNDVTDKDGNVLVASGAIAIGQVTMAKKRRALGAKGKISFAVNSVKAVDGTSVPLALHVNKDGDSKGALVGILGGLVAWPLLFIKGKAAVVPAGTQLNAMTVSSKEIQIQ